MPSNFTARRDALHCTILMDGSIRELWLNENEFISDDIDTLFFTGPLKRAISKREAKRLRLKHCFQTTDCSCIGKG